jgi:serine phosphatase RsbU (regulator of sigma subunit)
VTDVDRAPGLDAASLERILAPFAQLDGLVVSVQDATGRTIAGAPDASGSAAGSAARLTRDLRAGGSTVGRLVAEGAAVTDRTVAAALEALAVALEDLAGTGGAPADRAPATSADRRSGLAAELELSRLHQRSIVSLVPPDVRGYDLASHYESAREIGGDFFELFRLRKRGQPLGIVIGDVAGKGISAALLMAFARPIIHTGLMIASGPADALQRVNRILVEEIHTALFITALAGRLDPASGHVRLANAGHEMPILVPADGTPIVRIEGGGPLLGAFDPLDIAETELDLRPGDTLLLYTDGVTDAQAPTGERFGKQRLVETIEGQRGGSAHDLVAAIRDAVAAFRATAPSADDVTIVAVGRQAKA